MADVFDINGTITAERAQGATEWMVHNAAAIGIARARMQKAENMLRVVKSLAMKASSENAISGQEREAYASKEYREALELLFDATVQYETLLSTRKAAEAVIEVWRSLNSTLKASRA